MEDKKRSWNIVGIVSRKLKKLGVKHKILISELYGYKVIIINNRWKLLIISNEDQKYITRTPKTFHGALFVATESNIKIFFDYEGSLMRGIDL